MSLGGKFVVLQVKNTLKKRLEKSICKEFYNQVRLRQLYNEFKCEFFIFHIANEQFNNVGYTKSLMAMGLRSGVFDYCVIAKGKVGFIEFKRDSKHKLSPKQVEFKDYLDSLGIPYLVTWDSDEAIEWLKSFLRHQPAP